MQLVIANKGEISQSPRFQKYLAGPDQFDRVAGFRRWLSIFLIEHGQYKITQKGYSELAVDSNVGKKSARIAVAEKVCALIADGKASRLFDDGHVNRTVKADWSDRALRVAILRKFVGLHEDPKKIEWGDYSVAGLHRPISIFYGDSPYQTFVEIGIAYSQEEFLKHFQTGDFQADKFYPWEMKRAPHNIFHVAENRIAAVNWLLWKTGKAPIDISLDEIKKHMPGLAKTQYMYSPYLALVEAGFVYSSQEIIVHSHASNFEQGKIYPWEMGNVPRGFFQNQKHRIAAVRWVSWKLDKPIDRLSYKDLSDNGLGGLYYTLTHSELIDETLQAA